MEFHWTSDVNFATDIYFVNESHSACSREGITPFTFKAICLDSQIDKSATKRSDLEHGHESEIVLLQNTILYNVEVFNWRKHPLIKKINVGARRDTWV